MPIEAKMVSKAIERAQTTVEQRNAEIRKNVLKYDEVMNEQRKVIYKRRDQILEGADLKEEALEYLADAVDTTIDSFCVAEFAEEWDLDGLVTEIQTFWPSKLTVDELRAAGSTDAMYDVLMTEATTHYETREAELGDEAMREVERQVMLRIIDQRWREHLYEMDYLQEGINLRAMGQKDPLVEWQREGYSMFSEMMHGIARRLRALRHARAGGRQPHRAAERGSAQRSVLGCRGPGAGHERHARRGPGGDRRWVARRRGGRPGRHVRGAHDAARREVGLGQDAAQRPLPMRVGQEVQALPRPLTAGCDA